MRQILLLCICINIYGCGGDSNREEAVEDRGIVVTSIESPEVMDIEVIEEVVIETPEVVQRSVDTNPYDDYIVEDPVIVEVEDEDIIYCEDIPEQYLPGGAANPYGRYPVPVCKAYLITK